ncbi:thiamine pyrophosphate-binding protein [Leucobacter tardus]|uniref:Thiamine pyrophosphate-binding protein n=1 Tax=Leucobacter tardus TaxID=501483 RepID=A0A939TIX0_9MICO|nr:thiamine pyrophosphate-binding protein [Leucobacter tardus]MBO2988601.1 thiamine pyrophosphate-binding protein [Leucobacter tardus]
MTGPAAEGSASVAALVGRALARLGAGHCFGVVGSGNFHVTNALRAAGVPVTAARHEGGAATMADAFARMSETVALVSVHQGCGLTNAATGIAEAAKSRTPVLVLAAEAAEARSNFAMDQSGFGLALTAEARRVTSAETALAEVVAAFVTARDDRRTVVLNLPLDVQAAPAPVESLAALESLEPPPPPAPREAAAADATALADALHAARRPVIVAGRGARGAGDPLRDLAAASGALLATSAVANGLFADDPFALGISGGFASPVSAELIAGADLVVAVGCALNMWTTRHGRLLSPTATIAQIDDDPAALGLHRSIDVGVVGDAGATALAVTALLRERSPEGPSDDRSYRSPEVRERLSRGARWADVPVDDVLSGSPGDDARIDPRLLSAQLDRLLPAERIVAVDSGNFMGYPSAYLAVPDASGFCFTQAFQSVGLGLATAIGAATARPDRLPVLGAGDGGMLMSIAELETVVRLGLPLVAIVYNDDAYGAEVHHFGADADLSTVVFPPTDIAAIARGFGAEGVTVRSLEDLAPLTAWLARRAHGEAVPPIVLDARIASDGGSWWLAEAFRGH